MTSLKGQQGMHTPQRKQFCFYGSLTMALVVTMLGMASSASNETNSTNAITMIDRFSASTSAVTNTETSTASRNMDVNVTNVSPLSPTVNSIVPDDSFNISVGTNNSITDASSIAPSTVNPRTGNLHSIFSPYDTITLLPLTATNVPISVADLSGASANSVTDIINPNTNATASNVDATTTTNMIKDANIIVGTNVTSDDPSFDITSPVAPTNTTTNIDSTSSRSFTAGISAINSINRDINTAPVTRINVTDPSRETVVSITNASPNFISSTEATTTNKPAIINSANITSSAYAQPSVGCALTECQRLYSSSATPLMNISWWTNNDAEDWATFNRTTADGRWLVNTVRLHELATVDEGVEWTVVCVGAMYIASFSHLNSTTAMADVEIEIQASRDVPVGLVRLRTRCWLATGLFAECSPSFIPMPYMMDLPFYDDSPFGEEFWIQLTRAVMEVNASWIRRINITTLQGSISPQWIYGMHIPSLENLHITGNYWNVTDRILGNMSKLIHLDLSNNNIKSLPEEIFEDMQLLESLILNKNSLSKCPSSISRLLKLLYLELSNSVGNSSLRIEKEDIKLFPRSLRSLEVSNSNLQVNLEDILLLPELQFLNISRNRVKLHSDPSYTSKVEILDVSENKLLEIPLNFFSAMPFLKILILNHNLLYDLPDFPKHNNLTHLYASDNLLVSLSPTTFAYLEKLQVLDVSRCRIDFLGSAFVNLFSLRKVSLSHNMLRDINDYSFSFLPELQEVDFSHNYLKTVYLWTWKLRKLDLSSNSLIDFRSNMSAIEYVDFSYNHMQNIDIALSSVQILNISYNSLTYISPQLWENISQSLLVDLGGNYFLCCSFQNTMYLSGYYYTEILNLGLVEPIKCHINTEISKILFQIHDYDGDQCRTAKESITTFFIVLPLVIAVTLAAVLSTLTMFVIQFSRRKFVVKHSLDTVISSTSM